MRNDSIPHCCKVKKSWPPVVASETHKFRSHVYIVFTDCVTEKLASKYKAFVTFTVKGIVVKVTEMLISRQDRVTGLIGRWKGVVTLVEIWAYFW